MYSPRVNASMVSAIETRFKTTLRENSISEVQEMLDSLSDVWDEEGTPTRNYSPQEELFVRNELLMCSASFPYFAERYLTVTSKEGGLVPMYPLFPSQQFILKRISAIEEEIHDGKRSDGILVNLLKGSRQIGGSTLAEAIICHRITTQNYLNALIASDKPEDEGSAYLYGMQERMLTSLPRFLRPQITDRQKNREIKTDGGCHLMVGAGKSTRGITGQRGQLGRGTTLHLIHLSELSTWDNAGQIDDALMHAIPRAARVFVMFESTAKGRGPTNWWHHHWHVCKYSKTARFRNIFVPWYVESTYAIEAPADWSPSTATLAAAHRIEETSPLWAGERVEPTRSQLYWYEVTRKTAEEKGKLKKVMEEMLALDDEGCFQHAGEGIFPEELIQAIEDRARPMLALLDILPRKILQDKTRREAELLKSPRPKTLEQQYNDLALADDEENASA